MQRIRRFAMAAVAAAMLCALVASSASAVTALSGGSALAVGSSVNGTAGTTTLTGTFFGLSNVTITCSSSTVGGTVTNNPSSSGNVVGDINSATWTGCSSNQKASCSVTALNLPWTNPGSEGGLLAASTTSVNIGTGTSGSIDVTSCLSSGTTCHVTGGTGLTSFGSDSLANFVNGAWSNTASTVTMSAASVKNASGTTCLTNGGWTATYTLKTAGGGLITLQ